VSDPVDAPMRGPNGASGGPSPVAGRMVDGLREHSHPHAHDGLVAHDHPHVHVADGSSEPRVADEAADRHWIDLEHVHFRYPDGFEALHGVDLTVARGEKVALVGPNGAGKSTLMLHLNGTFRATHGSVRIAGMPVDRETIRRIRAEVGLVFQDPDDQLFSPTVFDDVAFGPLHMGLPQEEIHTRVERALDAVGMHGFARRVPHRMSLGQRKRVALATVLSMDPSVLVFDEPSAGLDPRGRRELIGLLRGMTQTLIVSTHDMRLVAEVFPRTVVMDGGEIVADGATTAILADEALLEQHGLEGP
jgi:cobalt/nickel transport system ATP-binding protein